MQIQVGFSVLLLGAALLEIAGYLAFPFIALRLRDHFGLHQTLIGVVLGCAIWIRPLSALAGGILSDFVKGKWLLLTACALEAICFFSLGIGSNAWFGIVGLILGNVGFSLWSPNLFALASGLGSEAGQVRRFSILTGAINAGAAIGCVLGGLIVSANAEKVFVAAGWLYLAIIPLLFPLLSRLEGQVREKIKSAPEKIEFRKLLPLLFTSFFYWSMYGQFNSFFVLFAKDWLNSTLVVGIAFACLAVSTSMFSYAFAQIQNPKAYLRLSLIFSLGLLSVTWIGLLLKQNLMTCLVFIVALGLSEALVSVFLAEGWSHAFVTTNARAQSYNFSSRSFAMGLGGLLGGLTYRAPASASSPALWLVLNALIVLAALIVVLRRA